MGNWMLGDEQLRMARNAVQRKRYLSESDLKLFENKQARGEVKGMMSACGKGTSGWNVTIAKQRGLEMPNEQRGELFSGLLIDSAIHYRATIVP
jgi:hypothetical protein